VKARALLAPALALLAGCHDAAPLRVAKERPTIVSLNPCADAILAEVAAPGQVLAISHYSQDPRASSMDLATAHRYRVTGGTVEEIIALQPDLVVAGSFLPPATVQALADLGIRVERLGIARRVADSEAQIRRLAALAGRPAGGEALVTRIDAALAETAPPPGHEPVSAVIWQSGGIVPGRDALVSDLLARTGFVSHSAARGLRQADFLPLEEILADPPQVILAAGTPGDGEDRMLSHSALKALDTTRRVRFDPSLLYCGGPTIIRAVRRLAEVREGI
jgi:iron complex transport system substrate-binding protein